jgi:hypothetical protein
LEEQNVSHNSEQFFARPLKNLVLSFYIVKEDNNTLDLLIVDATVSYKGQFTIIG